MYGTVQSAWKRSGNLTTYDITIPPNTTALIDLPGQTPSTVAAGTYHFEARDEKKDRQ
jgi:alpha-L-rhamnosidase